MCWQFSITLFNNKNSMTHLPGLISDLALILVTGAATTILFRRIRQPLVLGYILAGVLVGPHLSLFPNVSDLTNIEILADIGVIFLLFSLGLEFSFRKLRSVGGAASVTAFVEILFVSLAGYLLGLALGWKVMDSLFLGGMLASSSTTIIIKAFDELGLKKKRYAHVVFGVLIVEDIVVILMMVLLSTVAVTKQFEGTEMLLTIGKLLFFIILWSVGGIFIIPTLLKRAKKMLDEETLLILSIGLCLGMVVIAKKSGFSAELGAFIMGSILAETLYAEKVEHLIKPVKNMFGAIFFVSVGMMINPSALLEYRWPILWITLLVIFGKLVSTTAGALLSGQTLKQSVQVGMSMSQVGEFAFIVASLGISLKVTSDFLFPVVVGVSAITTFTTPYMIKFSEPFHRIVERTIPERWRTALAKYSVNSQNITEISDWRRLLRAYVFNVVLFSVFIIAIILLSTEYMIPWLIDFRLKDVVALAFTLILLAPFIWALAFRRTARQSFAKIWTQKSQRGPLLALEYSRIALAVFYLGFLFDRLYNPFISMIGAIVSFVLLILLAPRIRAFYGRLESRFLSNYHQRLMDSEKPRPPLSPWDSHITSFVLDPLSPYVGKTLQESRIREEFGVNVVMINRGSSVINVPTRDEPLYPGDLLHVIGTDEQLEAFRFYMEAPAARSYITDTHCQVSLHHFTLIPSSPLVGTSIRDSKIRELTRGLVVGVERNGERILNPESDFLFQEADHVWIVGNEKRIAVLMQGH